MVSVDKTDIAALIEVMRRLRDPESGCPWDVAQDFGTIAPYTIEEAYEVADAIARNDMADLCDELGDLLLQVVFHARMAQEQGSFAFADVVASIVEKMIRRHPHVFATAQIDDAHAQTIAWEDIKAAERADKGLPQDDPLADVPHGMAALQRAAKLQKRAARLGFDWTEVSSVVAKLREEIDELEAEIDNDGERARLQAELGDVLFSAVNLSRHLGVDAEGALVAANARFTRRFARVCLRAGGAQALQALSLDELEQLWQQAKRELAGAGEAAQGSRNGAR